MKIMNIRNCRKKLLQGDITPRALNVTVVEMKEVKDASIYV